MAMRLVIGLLTPLVITSLAAADTPKRKPPGAALPAAPAKASPDAKIEPPLPPAKQAAAHKLFAEAAAAAKAGDFDLAEQKYLRLYRLVPHPSIAFNLAQVQEAREHFSSAVDNYGRYLASVAPNEEPTLRKHVAALSAKPGIASLTFDSDFGEQPLVYIDGLAAFRHRGSVLLQPGRHTIDAISEVGYRHEVWSISPGHNLRLAPAFNPGDGNVVLSGNVVAAKFRFDGLAKDDFGHRFEQAPGTYDVSLKGYHCDYAGTVTIKPDEVTLVFVTVTPAPGQRADGTPKHLYELKDAECGVATFVTTRVVFSAKLPDVPFEEYPKPGFVAPVAGTAIPNVK
jgi:hypothetical protein